jgi:protein-disulfide isomerase
MSMACSIRRPSAPDRPAFRPARGRFAAAVLLLGAACALLPARPAAAGFTPEQRQEIETILKDYLVHHPDILLDALQSAEEKAKSEEHDKASAALAARRQEVFDDPATPVAGNPKGDVSLVEFFDYRCPYCKQVEPALEKLLGEDKDLRFVYKEFPVLGPASLTAARVALAARKQGKYEAFHRAMMALKGQIDDDAVFKVASSVGLDLDRLKRDMADPAIDRQLKANFKLAEALDIKGTPGFVIGSEIVPGAISLDDLKQLIDKARKSKK